MILLLKREYKNSSFISGLFYELVNDFDKWTDAIILNDADKNKKIKLMPVEYVDLYYYLAINYLNDNECNENLFSASSGDFFKSRLPISQDYSEKLNFKYLSAYYYIVTKDYSERHNEIEGVNLSADNYLAFLRYFKNDIEKNKMYKQFWDLCINTNAKGFYYIMKRFNDENNEDLFYKELELGLLYYAVKLFEIQNAKPIEILKLTNQFKNNTIYINQTKSTLIDAVYDSSYNHDIANNQLADFKALVKRIYKIREDF